MATNFHPGDIITVLCEGTRFRAIILFQAEPYYGVYFETMSSIFQRKYESITHNSDGDCFFVPVYDIYYESRPDSTAQIRNPREICGKRVYIPYMQKFGIVVSARTDIEPDYYHALNGIAQPMVISLTRSEEEAVTYFVHLEDYPSIEPQSFYRRDFVLLGFPYFKEKRPQPKIDINQTLLKKLFHTRTKKHE